MFAINCLQRFSGMSQNIGFSSLRLSSRNSFRQKGKILAKLQPPVIPPVYGFQNTGYHTLVKPFLFTVCFSGGVFVCASIWQYEDIRKKANYYRNRFGMHSKTTENRVKQELMFWWNRLTEGQKVAYVIMAANALVFLMWRVPSLQPFMHRYFACCPSSKTNCLPMFLSTFSHFSFLHLVTNMFVLHSFSTSAVAFFGKEQFVAVYLSAGVVSSFASYVCKVATRRFGPSLGASGALMAILSSVCLQFPHTQLAIVFFPFFTISAGKAIKIVMALDFVGLIAKWKVLDHAAHLGGACFGIFYLKYGRDYIWDKRERLVLWWHNFRQKIK